MAFAVYTVLQIGTTGSPQVVKVLDGVFEDSLSAQKHKAERDREIKALGKAQLVFVDGGSGTPLGITAENFVGGIGVSAVGFVVEEVDIEGSVILAGSMIVRP